MNQLTDKYKPCYRDIKIGAVLELKKASKMNIGEGRAFLRKFRDEHGITDREALFLFGVSKGLPDDLSGAA